MILAGSGQNTWHGGSGSPLKVAVLHPTFESWGGAERFIHGVLAALVASGTLEATVYTHRWTHPEGTVPYRVRQHLGGGVVSGPWDWAAIARRHAAEWAGADVLFVHNHPALEWAVRAPGHPPIVWYCQEPARHLWDADWLASIPSTGRGHWRQRIRQAVTLYRRRLPARLLSRTRLELNLRTRGDTFRELLRAMDLRAVERCSTVLANSRFTAARVREIYRRDATVVYPILPMAEAPVGRTMEKDPIVLWVGRMEAAKRPLLMLEAWEALHRRSALRGHRLIMVGGGPLLEEVARRAAPLVTQGCVELRGRLAREELEDLYRRAAVSVHTARAEPFGLVPLESMWLGTPVLAICEGGVSETVIPGRTGWCVAGANPESLADRLQSLLASEAELRRVAGSAAAETRRRFGFTTTVEQVRQALLRASGSRPAPSES